MNNLTDSTFLVTNTTAGFSLASILPIVLVGGVILGVLFASFSSKFFRNFWTSVGLLSKSFLYFLIGSAIFGSGYALYYIFSKIGEAVHQAKIPPEYFLYGVLAYVGLALLGWVGTKVGGKAIANYKQYKKETKKVKK